MRSRNPATILLVVRCGHLRFTAWHPSDNQPLLAVKLGHGRPLSLGSVQVAVDTIRRLRFDEHAYPTTEDHAGKDAVRAVLVRAFAKHLVDSLGAAKAL